MEPWAAMGSQLELPRVSQPHANTICLLMDADGTLRMKLIFFQQRNEFVLDVCDREAQRAILVTLLGWEHLETTHQK